MKATAKDLRFYSRELLDAVARGEEVLITYRGKPHAKLVPIEEPGDEETFDSRELFGMWSDYKELGSVEEYVRRIRRGRFE